MRGRGKKTKMNSDEQQHWDSYWQDEANLGFWLEPDEAVIALVKGLDRLKTHDVLDLGCGIGRHTRLFVDAGLTVTAVDISANALAVLRRNLGKETNLRLINGNFTQDLFVSASFDLVLCWNVLYHGTYEQFIQTGRLVHKWLRQGGLFFFTCPTRRDAKYGNGEEIAPHTYRPLNSIHPGDIHYFADERDISDILSDFTLVSRDINEHYWYNQGTQQFSSYWRILAKRR